MPAGASFYLIRQFDMAWKLAAHHFEGLSTEECLWRPATRGLHLDRAADGSWHGRMPEHEGYDVGPPSIAWLTWHIGYWWSMVHDHSFGKGQLTSHDQVSWPGTAESARELIAGLHDNWRDAITRLTENELLSVERTKWPFKERPFGDVIAWVNLELIKNISEIGYARFLYAASHPIK